MGRPYKRELEAMPETYEYIDSVNVEELFPFFKCNCNYPLLIIGSGGSFAVAKMFELCYKNYGGFAKAITPYELKDETKQLGNSKVLIVTAGGNNPDTVGVYNYVRLYEPFEMCVICLSKNSKISKAIKKNSDAILFETSIPFGKDGYLAVNSSIAMFTIAKNIMLELEGESKYIIDFKEKSEMYPSQEKMEHITNFIVLFGGWGTPAAYDFESKCSEAGLMSMQFVNYRNFAHGRHNWIDKNKESTMLVALITPQDKMICKKTLQKLPDDIPTLCFETYSTGSIAAIELLVKVFYFVGYLGELKNIDPGQPHVPDFGSKLYNIKYNLLSSDKYLKKIAKNTKESCIYRKMKLLNNEAMWYEYYSKMYDSFVNRLSCEKYNALLLDYDGTVCGEDGEVKSKLIIGKLIELLENNIVIGFATGRGDSIIAPLQKNIPPIFWDKIIIGYYNGSYIANLSKKPDFRGFDSTSIKQFYNIVKDLLPSGQNIICKECQMSIREKDSFQLNFYHELLNEIKYNHKFDDVQIYMSGHAVDVIANNSGKQKVVEYIKSICDANVLCIGDEGRLYQNDYGLLADNIGISSNYQNKMGDSGWNLAPLGVRNVSATEFYFSKMRIYNTYFILEKFN